MPDSSQHKTVLAVPVFVAYAHHQLSAYLVIMASALLLAVVTGIASLLVSQLFPTPVRYSGIAFAYNVSFAIFGGLTPLIAMTLIKTTGGLPHFQRPDWVAGMSVAVADLELRKRAMPK